MKIKDLFENLGSGYPGTYEQDYNRLRSKGPQHIISLTEDDNTITLNQLYSEEFPDDNELIWNHVGYADFDIPFKIKSINPSQLEQILTAQYDCKSIKNILKLLNRDQKKILAHYQVDPQLSNEIIVLDDADIIDGNHRALAAILTNRSIKYIDISDEEVN